MGRGNRTGSGKCEGSVKEIGLEEKFVSNPKRSVLELYS